MTDKISDIAASFEHCQNTFKSWMQVQRIGCSFEDRPIYSFRWGSGATKILIYSTINGKDKVLLAAILSTMKLLEGKETDVVSYGTLIKWKAKYTLYFIPVLNPDGLFNACLENAMGINIYQDAKSQITPESQILEATVKSFEPDFIIGLKSDFDKRILDNFSDRKKLLLLDIPLYKNENTSSLLDESKSTVNALYVVSYQVAEKLNSCVDLLGGMYSSHDFGTYFLKNGVPTLNISPLDNHQDIDVFKVVNLVEKSLIYIFNSLSDLCNVVEEKSIPKVEYYAQKAAEFDILFKKASITAKNGKRFIADVGLEKNTKGYKLKQIGDLEGAKAKEVLLNRRFRLDELHNMMIN